MGFIVRRSIISQEIFFNFSSLEETSRAFIIDGPKPINVRSLPFFLINDFYSGRRCEVRKSCSDAQGPRPQPLSHVVLQPLVACG